MFRVQTSVNVPPFTCRLMIVICTSISRYEISDIFSVSRYVLYLDHINYSPLENEIWDLLATYQERIGNRRHDRATPY